MASNDSIRPPIAFDSKRTVTEKVMGEIRTLLVTGALQPGARIDQVELAKRFDVSLVPVREALARLASVGLVEIIAHRGAFVAAVSADELVDIYTVREILEEQAANLAVDRLTDGNIAVLETLADEMGQVAPRGNVDRLLSLNRQFHFELYRAANRPHMLHIIERLWDLSARYAHLQLHAVPQRAVQSLTEVREIVAACRRRDKQAVGMMVRYKVHQTTVGLLERMPATVDRAAPASARQSAGGAREARAAKPRKRRR
jgi:DNA-binding GntR family transcriptional regulator